ncbi:(2Fe-2S)-binding protein [Psychrobacillus sp. OK032]|uniref:(2Fe-2S)-binding protein n=1 Tax=Psychrobacillus sp. OK032 TaxID=1884358 RepID=UPI0008D778E0|nr:(2Fe-2S)-binding protein [Psychrobacillus sp. OK032]SES19260.1 sarcosine oxidase subunit alpha [Psychrobacillus sp. OK032]
MTRRIINHPVLDKIDETNVISFTFNNTELRGLKNESLAAALLANGIRTLRVHEESGTPRGIYCNIGHCFECRVTVDGQQGVRACLTPLKEGINVSSGETFLTSVRDWRSENE